MKRNPLSKPLEITLSQDSMEGLVEEMALKSKTAGHKAKLEGIVIGNLAGFASSGTPHVLFPGSGSEEPVIARSLVALGKKEIGRKVALQFEDCNPGKPIILGLIQSLSEDVETKREKSAGETGKKIDVELDGERLLLTADKEIVLRCGRASITLTQAGKMIIRGTDLLSRSSGVNRIKGGSVQIN
jgi:hypothetical protein